MWGKKLVKQQMQESHYLRLCDRLTLGLNIVEVFRSQKRGKALLVSFNKESKSLFVAKSNFTKTLVSHFFNHKYSNMVHLLNQTFCIFSFCQ